MSKPLCVGIDVSAKTVSVAWRDNRQRDRSKDYPNTKAGFDQILIDLGPRRPIRVALEATGVYHLDLAVFLDNSPDVAVMVVNPKASHNFGQAVLTRSKTDTGDAAVLLMFCERMPWQPWCAPSPAAFELRSLSRYGTSLRLRLAAEKTRLKQCDASEQSPPLIREDIVLGIDELVRRIERIQSHALLVIAYDEELARLFELLQTAPGFAEVSGVQLLAELAVLPTDMTAKQWVAHAGLDPKKHESGTSINRPCRISKVGNRYVRRSLFMPALVAFQCDAHVSGFYQHLVAKGKPGKVAVVAVMRKLLHAVWGMFKSGQPWDSTRFYRLPAVAVGPAEAEAEATPVDIAIDVEGENAEKPAVERPTSAEAAPATSFSEAAVDTAVSAQRADNQPRRSRRCAEDVDHQVADCGQSAAYG